MKKILILLVVFMGQGSFAELSSEKMAEFAQVCHTQHRRSKDYAVFCECYKENLRWLIEDKDLDFVTRIATGKVTMDEMKNSENGESEYGQMLVNIEIACAKDPKYVSEKAKDLKEKKKKK